MKTTSTLWLISNTEGWTTIQPLWVINLSTRTKCYCNHKWIWMILRHMASIRIQAVAISASVEVWQIRLESVTKTQFHIKEARLNKTICTISSNSTWTHRTLAMDMERGRAILIQLHHPRWWEIWIRTTWCLITIQATTRWARINSSKCSITTHTVASTCLRTTKVGSDDQLVELTAISFLSTGSTLPICINKLGQILLAIDQPVPLFNNSQ